MAEIAAVAATGTALANIANSANAVINFINGIRKGIQRKCDVEIYDNTGLHIFNNFDEENIYIKKNTILSQVQFNPPEQGPDIKCKFQGRTNIKAAIQFQLEKGTTKVYCVFAINIPFSNMNKVSLIIYHQKQSFNNEQWNTLWNESSISVVNDFLGEKFGIKVTYTITGNKHHAEAKLYIKTNEMIFGHPNATYKWLSCNLEQIIGQQLHKNILIKYLKLFSSDKVGSVKTSDIDKEYAYYWQLEPDRLPYRAKMKCNYQGNVGYLSINADSWNNTINCTCSITKEPDKAVLIQFEPVTRKGMIHRSLSCAWILSCSFGQNKDTIAYFVLDQNTNQLCLNHCCASVWFLIPTNKDLTCIKPLDYIQWIDSVTKYKIVSMHAQPNAQILGCRIELSQGQIKTDNSRLTTIFLPSNDIPHEFCFIFLDIHEIVPPYKVKIYVIHQSTKIFLMVKKNEPSCILNFTMNSSDATEFVLKYSYPGWNILYDNTSITYSNDGMILSNDNTATNSWIFIPQESVFGWNDIDLFSVNRTK